jgi:AMP-binding enzyme
VILHDPRGRPATTRIGGRATLDELLRRAAQRRPDDVALADPPNRASFTDGPPRRLTYAQADRMVSAIAGRLRRIGLYSDAVVGLQIANTVESVLTLLGVLRAGLIAMPLPLLWRRAETVAALGRVGAHALIVSGRIGAADHYDLAMQIAAEVFPVRYVCGYGGNAPDGVIPLDALFSAERLDPLPSLEDERAAEPGPGAHLAVVTWDMTAEGLVPVGRSHAELIAGGLAVMLEGRLEQDAVMLTTLTMSSFGGLAVAVVPWLLLGGTLALHQPFEPDVLLEQLKTTGFDTVIVPGPLTGQLAETGHLATRDQAANVIGVWRAPERLVRALPWRAPKTRLTDVQVFGEAGLIAGSRAAGGRPLITPFGVVPFPRAAKGAPKGALTAVELAMTPHGTVALRGPMVPRAPFPQGAERSGLPCFRVAANGFVDTGYACRPDSAALVVTGPPPGIVSVGGYRFVVRELQDLVSSVENGAGTLAVLPDALAGHRLAGTAADRDAIQGSLVKLGANPLLVGAFRDRRQAPDDERLRA